jgi:GH15 family glucan-1,4-alpha-glucosidase
VALDAADEHAAARRFHEWVAARVLAHEQALRRAIEAVASGSHPAPEDLLPCRFEAGGRAPRDDGWGAFQMDGPGLWLWALHAHARSASSSGGGAGSLGRDLERAAAVAAEYVTMLWGQPSYDAWEEHGEHSSTSTLAACLAGLISAHRLGIEPAAMPAAVTAIRHELAGRARRAGHLPRSDADDAVDASLLWCGPLLGAFHPADAAWQATLERVETQLQGPDGGVHRYAADTFYGGGQWPVLTAALGLAYLGLGRSGDLERARHCADWTERQRAADGSLPEQTSGHLLQPARLAEWERRWGPVASPLSWSHAMSLLLRRALAEASPDEASADEASADEASADEASPDEASPDEASAEDPLSS